MPHHSDTIKDWLVSNRLYEDNLFYYALIICFWFFWGFAFLGFEIDGYSQVQNLFFNFIYYLVICTMMALCPFWFKLLFKKTHTAKREQELQAHLNKLSDDDRQKTLDYLAQTGQLAMRPIQRWALVFLGSYFLFEVFFISAWVREMTLVWQPDWVMGIVEWVRENTSSAPIAQGGTLFDFDPQFAEDEVLYQYYQTEEVFLSSELGKTAMLFTFIKTIGFFPIIFALMTAFGLMSGWLGIGQIKSRMQTNLWGLIFATALMCGAGLMALMAMMMTVAIADDRKIIPLIEKGGGWVAVFDFNIVYLFFMIFVMLFIGWVYMIIDLALSFVNFVKRVFL